MTQPKSILFIAHGTRGDVQPAIALGKAMQARGYRVRLLASPNFADWIESHGLGAIPSRVDVQDLMNSEGGQEWVEKGSSPYRQLQIMRRLLLEHGHAIILDTWEAAQDADAVISSFTSTVYTLTIAERLQIPHLAALLQPPLWATRDGRALMNAPLPNRASWINRLFGKLFVEPANWQLYGQITNDFRRDVLGLPASDRRDYGRDAARIPTLLGYSPGVVPHPADWPNSVLPPTGYWFLPEAEPYQPPAALVEFLAAGEPPVYIGFGSMTGRDAAGMTRLMLEAVRRAGCRAILHAGWAGLSAADLPDTVFGVGSVPHDWLFPRMAAVVHHGGAGTTGTGLAAGAPTIIVPHMSDQPFWGARVAALGVGPEPISRPKLTADKLAAAIVQATSDADMAERARRLGAEIRAEEGIGRATALIEQYLLEI